MSVMMVTLQAKAGCEPVLENMLRELVSPTQQEAGAVVYAIHRLPSVPGGFAVYERYVDPAALEQHMVSPHVQAFLARLPAVLAGEPHIMALEALAGFVR